MKYNYLFSISNEKDVRNSIYSIRIQNKFIIDENFVGSDDNLKNKINEISNRDSSLILNEEYKQKMPNMNNASQISSNLNMELPSLLKQEKNTKINDNLKKYIEDGNRKNENNKKKEENLNNIRTINISFYEYIFMSFFKKKKSKEYSLFETFKHFLKSKSSIDTILKSVLGIDLLKKLIFNKEDQEIIEKIEFFNQNI